MSEFEFSTEWRSGERALDYIRRLEAVSLEYCAPAAETFKEDQAWQRWLALVAFYPCDSYRPAGMGQG